MNNIDMREFLADGFTFVPGDKVRSGFCVLTAEEHHVPDFSGLFADSYAMPRVHSVVSRAHNKGDERPVSEDATIVLANGEIVCAKYVDWLNLDIEWKPFIKARGNV